MELPLILKEKERESNETVAANALLFTALSLKLKIVSFFYFQLQFLILLFKDPNCHCFVSRLKQSCIAHVVIHVFGLTLLSFVPQWLKQIL